MLPAQLVKNHLAVLESYLFGNVEACYVEHLRYLQVSMMVKSKSVTYIQSDNKIIFIIEVDIVHF